MALKAKDLIKTDNTLNSFDRHEMKKYSFENANIMVKENYVTLIKEKN